MRLASALAVAILAALPGAAAADDRADIAALRRDWAADLRNKRLEPSVARYAPDAVFFGPDGSSAAGTEQIRTLFDQVMHTWDSELHFDSRHLSISGGLACDSGDYEETLTPHDGSPALHLRGSYLMVLRKARNARWRIQQQMWTVQPPQHPG